MLDGLRLSEVAGLINLDDIIVCQVDHGVDPCLDLGFHLLLLSESLKYIMYIFKEGLHQCFEQMTIGRWQQKVLKLSF